MQGARGRDLDVVWVPRRFIWKRLGPQPDGVEVIRPLRSWAQLEAIAGPFASLSGFLPADTLSFHRCEVGELSLAPCPLTLNCINLFFSF